MQVASFFIIKSLVIFLSYQSKSLKFVYSEKATKFCEISTLLLSTVHTTDKSKVEILQKIVAFSEYMNSYKLAPEFDW